MKPSYEIEKWAAIVRLYNARLSNSEAVSTFIYSGELRYCSIDKEWQVYPRLGNFYRGYSNKAALQHDARFSALMDCLMERCGIPYRIAGRIVSCALHTITNK